MVLWRISRHRDLSGRGGLKAAGRWHDKGSPIVYMSENPATALLEVCVHTVANDVPPTYTLLRIEGPQVEVPTVNVSDLAEGWQERDYVTQVVGSLWLARGEDVVLRVPSAIVPHTWNVLFNPLHPLAKEFKIAEAVEYPFDNRIKK
jgi:RES domain-containing protein